MCDVSRIMSIQYKHYTYQYTVANGRGRTGSHLNYGSRHLSLQGYMHGHLYLRLRSPVVLRLGLVGGVATRWRREGGLVSQGRPAGRGILTLPDGLGVGVASLSRSATGLWIGVRYGDAGIGGSRLRRVARLWLMALLSGGL